MKVAATVEFDGGLDARQLEGDGSNVVSNGVGGGGGGSRRRQGVGSQDDEEEIARSFSSISRPNHRLLSFL